MQTSETEMRKTWETARNTETSGHTGCFRNILPESVAEFEQRLADAGMRFRCPVFVPGVFRVRPLRPERSVFFRSRLFVTEQRRPEPCYFLWLSSQFAAYAGWGWRTLNIGFTIPVSRSWQQGYV